MEDCTALMVVEQLALPAELTEALELASDFAKASKAKATQEAYGSDFRIFESWCRARGLSALPATPAVLCGFLANEASTGKRAGTLGRRLAAIRYFHRAADLDSPTTDERVKAVLSGIRRTIGAAPIRKKAATADLVLGMVGGKGRSLRELRDRAILLLGFAGAFRRSELVGLDAGDVAETAEGLVVTLRRSKTDQEGEGRKVGIPYGSNPRTCPVRALRTWREATAIADGPLFRSVDRHGRLLPARLSDKAVALVVKRAAAAAGLDPTKYAGHSLRAGLATAAAAANVPERVIALQTGHKSMAILRRYIREGSLFRENAAAAVGL